MYMIISALLSAEEIKIKIKDLKQDMVSDERSNTNPNVNHCPITFFLICLIKSLGGWGGDQLKAWNQSSKLRIT